MEKKFNILLGGLISLVIMYFVSNALQETLTIHINESLGVNTATDPLLKLILLFVNMSASGVLEVIIGVIGLVLVFLEDLKL